jgi:hypothetical protein
MRAGGCADGWAMTSTIHDGDVLVPTRLRRLASPWLHSRMTLAQGLAPLAALGVLGLLIEGHGLAWLAGLLAGASTTAWLVGVRAVTLSPATTGIDHGDADTREQLSLLQAAGWSAIHDLDARHARYRHVAIGPGGVILVQSQRLEHPWASDDPGSQRELLILRRRALAAAGNLRHEIEDSMGIPGWVQAVVVVWSEFPPGCLQDGRCVFVAGPRLIDWLRRRPEQLSPARAAEIHAALQRLATGSAPSAAPIAA